ncbi:MAG: hypothetical protein P8013_00555 [Candidatus Sulfobium sp.]|jgi:ribosomal protein S17
MKKRFLAVACSLSLLLAVGACKKKQEQPAQQPEMPGQQMPQAGPQPGMPGQMPSGHVVMPKGETNVVVPDSVKGKWKAVVIAVEDKTTKKTTEYTVDLRSKFKIPDSDLTVYVGDFLPDFQMQGLTLTSKSDQPNNPAAGIRVEEGKKQIFPPEGKKWGWIYARPELHNIHPFEHAKYGIVLVKGVKKG